MPLFTPDPAPPPAGSEALPDPPKFAATPRPWSGLFSLGLDRFGLTQAIGGLVLGLIALFSSYDHIAVAGRSIPLQQQWGIPFIAASVATVVVGFVQYSAPLGRDAQLASRSRLRAAREAVRTADEAARAAQDAARAEDEAARERNRADQERNRAAEARERQAQVAERQNEGLDLLRRSALLSARFQLDPDPTNRAKLQLFLNLIGAEWPPQSDQSP